MNKIKKIRKISTLEAATAAIQDYVIENKLQVGDSLPTEMELTRSLGISRSIVREAMQHFRTLGMISSKTRSGAEIRQLLPADPFQDYLPFISADPKAFHELAESRLCLETGAVPLLIKKATPQHLATLREICQKMKEAKDISALNQLDMEFHRILLGIPENRLLSSFLPLLVNFFQSNMPADPDSANFSTAKDHKEHLDIVNALEKCNADQLRQLLESHLQTYINASE